MPQLWRAIFSHEIVPTDQMSAVWNYTNQWMNISSGSLTYTDWPPVIVSDLQLLVTIALASIYEHSTSGIVIFLSNWYVLYFPYSDHFSLKILKIFVCLLCSTIYVPWNLSKQKMQSKEIMSFSSTNQGHIRFWGVDKNSNGNEGYGMDQSYLYIREWVWEVGFSEHLN